MPEDVHHSLDLDVGVDRISARARLVSIEFKSSTAFGEGKVRPSEPLDNPSGTEDGGWTVRVVPIVNKHDRQCW